MKHYKAVINIRNHKIIENRTTVNKKKWYGRSKLGWR